ncbi:MAG TPA: ABC transporter ATP-binding protein [Rhodoferax sp.]|uniref:ABC transporter ATP-binding protein n=1 Tax=Rhodoferax sp. TaxID=50421 RepID=UPI000A5B803A|nr:ABC transporter ATP-binding protein [Rhodoferax sp.]HCX81163.1 ABC transporter ATP-binding protein [Rhodoferax sp.]
MKAQTLAPLMASLWGHISSRRRHQIFLLLGLMILASFAEILSIGAVLPFLGVLTASDRVFNHPLAQPFITLLELQRPSDLLLPLTVAFGVAALVTGALRLTLLWANTKLSYSIGADISKDIYRRTLYQPYATHISRNSSEVINGISNKASVVIHSAVTPMLTLISSLIMLVTILAALLTVDPIIAIAAFAGFGAIYAVVIRIARRRLAIDSQRIADESTRVMKSLQEGLGGIRDVLLDGTQEVYCQAYESADGAMRRAQGNNQFISQSPRYGMEALGMILISALAYMLAQQSEGVSKAIPVLGALALGAQRMIPVLQQAYWSWASFEGGLASLRDTLELLEQPLPDYALTPLDKPLEYQKYFAFRDVSFRYGSQGAWVINNLSIDIRKGSRVGLIGKTGSGKSTVLDILMGLLVPTRGQLLVDDVLVNDKNIRRWQLHIAHVPQSIYLADCSIAENIAFGIPQENIDWVRVREAAQQAQMAGVIESWPEKYQTTVGERGVRLSGGQRQRIGIARALYKKADVLVFDEATSALDSDTEQSVMQAIDGLSRDLTIIIIAHRLTTLKGCSEIIELSAGELCRRGTYEEIVSLA